MENNRKWSEKIIAIFTACVITAAIVVCTGMLKTYAEEELPFNRVKVSFPSVTLELSETAAESDLVYTFELTADDSSNPMPDTTVLEMTEAGEASFGDAIFELPGDYYYTVHQTTEAVSGLIIDSTVYKIRVHAYLIDEMEDGKVVTADKLVATVILGIEGEANKPAKILFKNTDEKGSLKIVKDLLKKENVEGRLDPATFVFSLDFYEEDELIRSDVVSMVFNSAGADYVEIQDIPIGTKIVVSEVYAGGNYKISGSTSQTVTIESSAAMEVQFTNNYDDTWKGGGSVTNSLAADGSGGTATYSDETVESLSASQN